VAWLDRYQPTLQGLIGGGYAGTASIQKSQMDPRYNAFDWETWYECDVFRAEVEGKLKRARNLGFWTPRQMVGVCRRIRLYL